MSHPNRPNAGRDRRPGAGNAGRDLVASRRSGASSFDPGAHMRMVVGAAAVFAVAFAGLLAWDRLGSDAGTPVSMARAAPLAPNQHFEAVAKVCRVRHPGGGPRMAERVDAMADGIMPLQFQPDQLVCLMTTEPKRLCDDSERSRLAKELGLYFKNVAERQAAFDRMFADAGARQMGEAFLKIDAAANDDEPRSLADRRPKPDGSVMDKMRSLAIHGYLSAADFSGSSQKLVAPHLAKVNVLRDACSE